MPDIFLLATFSRTSTFVTMLDSFLLHTSLRLIVSKILRISSKWVLFPKEDKHKQFKVVLYLHRWIMYVKLKGPLNNAEKGFVWKDKIHLGFEISVWKHFILSLETTFQLFINLYGMNQSTILHICISNSFANSVGPEKECEGI